MTSAAEPAETHHQLVQGQALVADLADVNLAGVGGVVWALASPQLNANLVTMRAGDEIQEHVNAEVDVLIVTDSGSGQVEIDGVCSDLRQTSVVLIPQGARRSIRATTGLVYYSIHQRRSGPSLDGER